MHSCTPALPCKMFHWFEQFNSRHSGQQEVLEKPLLLSIKAVPEELSEAAAVDFDIPREAISSSNVLSSSEEAASRTPAG